MTRTSKYLNQDTIAALQSFQIEKIDREITDYLDTNNKMNTYHFEYCPKCGCYHPRLIKSGFANSGKQMLRCKECGKRFVVDRGQLTFYEYIKIDRDKSTFKSHRDFCSEEEITFKHL